MLLLARNTELITNQEKTYLTVAVSASTTANQVITVQAIDSNAWADDDYIVIGEIGTKNAELMRISAAVSDGTSLTISRTTTAGTDTNGCRYNHSINEPVYRVLYNRAEFSRATTEGGTKTTLATNEIQFLTEILPLRRPSS